MNTIDNTYEEIAQHSRRGRKRDIVFAVLLAAVAAFSIASLRSAQQTVDAGYGCGATGVACRPRRTAFSTSTATNTIAPTATHASHSIASRSVVPKSACIGDQCVRAAWSTSRIPTAGSAYGLPVSVRKDHDDASTERMLKR